MTCSINDGALQLEGIHKRHQRGQPAELDALIDLSHLEALHQRIRTHSVSFKEKKKKLNIIFGAMFLRLNLKPFHHTHR